jgi:2-polyprenyl-3-methyl-5-hydroxy-6-metoxy-1,4-benzoquinol methylase
MKLHRRALHPAHGGRIVHGGLVLCEQCGYIHLNPLPTQQAVELLYQDEYYTAHNAGWFDKEAKEQWYWRAVYRERLGLFEHLSRWDDDSMRYVWDWGAGCGWFVRAAGDYDPLYLAAGNEPNEYARQYAHRSVTPSVLANVAECHRQHLIHCSLVLEHVIDPLTLLKEIHFRLHPGGLACIVVPNEFNPLQRQLMERYDYTPVHEHHVNYFTVDSLRKLAKNAGFSVVDTLTTVPVEWFALHGLNYVKHPRLGAVVHWLRMVIEWSALTFASQWWENKRREWAARGIGREVEIWLRRA